MTERVIDYNVFISWSGETSKKIAYAVQNWLSNTIQAAEPFVSDKNIDAGDRGLEEIANQLDNIKVGIICLTSQNQGSAWINFEAGALSKTFGNKSYVIPLLFDLDAGQVRHPLGQFQSKRFTEDDMAAVARTVNKSLGYQVSDDRLTTTMQWTWKVLDQAIEAIRAEASQQVLIEEPKRTAEDMFEEIVVAIREQSSTLNDVRKSIPKSTVADKHLELTTEALQKLSDIYGRSRRMNVKALADMGDRLDEQDWRIIDTAPFLRWYLEHYHNLRRPPVHSGYGNYGSYGNSSNYGNPSEDDAPESLNDVPF